MKSPTKEQIDEALFYVSLGMGDNQGAYEEEHRCAELLAVAYRSALARAELAERHEQELIAIIPKLIESPLKGLEPYNELLKKFERERKELEA